LTFAPAALGCVPRILRFSNRLFYIPPKIVYKQEKLILTALGVNETRHRNYSKPATDVVLAMKGATLFSDQRDLEDYIDMVLRNAKMLSGVELTVRGDTPDEKAASFLDALIKHGLAEVQDDKPARIPIPALVWQGIDAVRLSGLTNMLDRLVVARLAGELGWPDAARWIEEHPKEYAEGVFRGFIVDPQGGKS
jgi:hypothetical protein